MTTWGDMAGKPAPEPTTVINQVESEEISWLLEMAELGIHANYFVHAVPEAEARLQAIREALGLL
jgi:hypothetical protein